MKRFEATLKIKSVAYLNGELLVKVQSSDVDAMFQFHFDKLETVESAMLALDLVRESFKKMNNEDGKKH